MTLSISQQLKAIQTASGLSQSKIAESLGVSFATVNSWINERSMPHQKKQEDINNLFEFYVSGKAQVVIDRLAIKKQKIISKSKKAKNIGQKIVSRPDLRKQFILSLTYNTNRLEGSTLTEDDTAAVIFDNISLSEKTINEQLEAKNHQAVLNFVFDNWLNSNQEITEDLILKLHSILMNSILDNAGIYRAHPVRIVGSNVPTSNWQTVPEKMRKLIQVINDKKQKDAISQISFVHAQFEQIHPFSDGNGRIGRVIMHLMALRNDLPPVFIENTRKRIYYKYLQKAQLRDKYSFLEDFVCDAILISYEIIKAEK